MMRSLLLAVSILLVAGCYQTSSTPVSGPPSEMPNASGTVNLPPEAWTVDSQCVMDTDCLVDTKLGACERAVCVDGKCVAKPQRAGLRCELPSGQLLPCQVGACVDIAGKMECKAAWAPDGTTCGTYYAACGAASTCQAGKCTDPCMGKKLCHTGECKPDGCHFSPGHDGAACSDGNPCTNGDVCSAGVCTGTVVCQCASDADCASVEHNPCDGKLTCQSGTCKVKAGTKVVCPETGFEPCETNACDSLTGKCVVAAAADETPCSDGNDCTVGDACLDGRCTQIDDVVCEFLCADELDDDDDGKTDCLDPDCATICGVTCGNTLCEEGEDCDLCPEDCGPCGPVCGDGTCNGDETCTSCEADCGVCPPECGDGVCNGDETCITCIQDCPANCTGLECGPDANGCGNCGTCPGTQDECQAGTCVCVPACDGKVCGPDGCGGDCGTCGMDQECVVDQCLLLAGETCTLGTECASNSCADGVCCDSDCTDTCTACNLAGSEGTCSFVPDGQSDVGCEGTCDGAGNCLLAQGTACTTGTECATANCVDGVCCDTDCTGTCAACNLTGTEGTCTFIPDGTDPFVECPGGHCDGAGACVL